MFDQSIQIAKFAGIPVKVHWSLGLFIFFIFGVTFSDSGSTYQSLFFTAYIVLLFISVLLHEYGHALTAKQFGIKTRDIILSPIGGLARLEFIPEIPRQELIIAFAGPFVNICIAAILLPFFFLLSLPFALDLEYIIQSTSVGGIIQMFFWMNLVLFAFNLLPIFPMDGGRILRALLSYKYGHFTASKVAVFVGKILGIALFFFSIFSGQFIASIIAVFIFISAHREITTLSLKALLKNTTANKVMRTQYEKIYLSDTITKPLTIFKSGKERSFLVFDNEDNVVGAIHELFLEEAGKKGSSFATIEEIRSDKVGHVDLHISLEDLYQELNEKAYSIVGVKNESQNLVGVIDRHDFGLFVKKNTKFRWL